jgi:hypothetical protein
LGSDRAAIDVPERASLRLWKTFFGFPGEFRSDPPMGCFKDPDVVVASGPSPGASSFRSRRTLDPRKHNQHGCSEENQEEGYEEEGDPQSEAQVVASLGDAPRTVLTERQALEAKAPGPASFIWR